MRTKKEIDAAIKIYQRNITEGKDPKSNTRYSTYIDALVWVIGE